VVIDVVVFFLVYSDRRQLVEQRDALIATDHSVGIERKRAESGGEEDEEGVKENSKKVADVEKRTDDDGMAATPETSRTHVMDVGTNGNAEIAKSLVFDPSDKVNGGVAASAAGSPSAVEAGKSSAYANGGTADTITSRDVADNAVEDGVIGSSRGKADTTTTDTIPEKVTKHRAEVDFSSSAKHTKTIGGGDDNVDRKKRSRESSAADATTILEKRPVTKRVVRTSTPSRKYLDGSQQRHPQEFSGSASMQPLPINATGMSGHSANGGNLRAHPHRLSVEQVHGEFEKKLRDSVRLH
jgi:hypothetical protein